MKVLDPGHVYGLANLDVPEEGPIRLTHSGLNFVKRVGDKYPGNTPPAHFGTTLQEVWRACIDRLQYLDKQDPHPVNQRVILNLRSCIYALEQRTAERHGRKLSTSNLNRIELLPVCEKCGHIECPGDCRPQPPQPCAVFMSAGPPWYGASCRLANGHEGEHDFGTQEEAKAAFYGPEDDNGRGECD